MKYDKCFFGIVSVALLCGSCAVSANWEPKYYNPKPAPDDVLLPMPCDGVMVFRKVNIPLASPLDDYSITLGKDGDDWGYIEQSRPEHIAGSFTESHQAKARYYLMAKYELTELQYQAIQGNCVEPSNKLLLPQVNKSWMEAMNAANQYNLWLLKNKPDSLPVEDGYKGFLRLPTETEWEFAERGGLAVQPSVFRDNVFPMEGGVSNYVWFAGSQSSNGKLQVVGLLQPNPLGLHDMLGNAAEMTFEPFRLNKLDRHHGQAGGFVTRGGHYQTSQAEIRNSLRTEEPYYTNEGENQKKTNGFRFVVVSRTLTSRDRIKEIESEWNKLGAMDPKGQAKQADSSLSSLSQISANVQDTELKNQLEVLRGEIRANTQLRDEQRDQAIRTSLQLGAFLCTKLKDDGVFYDRLNSIYLKTCKAEGNIDANCPKRQTQLEEHKKTLDFIVGYYADTLIEMGTTYNNTLVGAQISVVKQQLSARGKTNLNIYLDTYWDNIQAYWKDGKVSRDEWLEMCKKNN
ncbi:SUMF1/EgtB/PvdO family nonheme iron enzyme [Dickeya chrysanthemi]|uniref:SUMF1/EgtB/PvdO family nonheme iron enzyme n=1 Tax=Dickeya chrysanthemi TaxID=556 RepID=UPI00039FD717|nr:SUMF1/EgtB/PvdO family nonheme iron enzyme [Dickeya chrysanthemi]